MEMRVVITGQSGFIGTNLTEHLGFLFGESLDILPFNSNDHDVRSIPDFNPDLIFHLGAEIYDHTKMKQSNIDFTFDMLNAAARCSPKAFIYCGSSSEYGAKSVRMREDQCLSPRNMYEATKGCGTLLCQAFANAYGVPTQIVRPFSVYGKHEKKHRFMPTLMRKFLCDEQVTIYPGNHDWIYIDDFIAGMMAIALSPNKLPFGNIFNIGTGIQRSNTDVYEAFCSAFGKRVPVHKVEHHKHEYDSHSWCADVQKIFDSYGFQATTTLEEGIKKMYNERIS
jgi:nucleoside-diphosphate-sugar epimerase